MSNEYPYEELGEQMRVTLARLLLEDEKLEQLIQRAAEATNSSPCNLLRKFITSDRITVAHLREDLDREIRIAEETPEDTHRRLERLRENWEALIDVTP